MSGQSADARGVAAGFAPLTPTSDAPEPVPVLVVDDDDAVRKLVVRMLGARGFRVDAAASGAAALDALARSQFTLALCDVQMPGMSGVELVRRALEVDPDLAILMLTGADDAGTATEALSGGAFDYLTKPIDWAKLDQAIGRALHKRRLVIEQRRVERLIREEVELQTAQLRTLSVGVAEALVKAMEAKSVFLRGHAERTAKLAASIAEALGLATPIVEQVRLAARLHDLGKIGVRDAILEKPGKLTPEEYGHVKDHVRIGMEILSALAHLGPVLRFIDDHHERWDGDGYPRGLQGEQISIGGRILAAVDAFDALTSPRSYQEAMSPEDAVTYLAMHSGALMDPRVYEALREVIGPGRSPTAVDDVHG
ncbi:MAG: HD-GYP domain-containing protein [Gemmatimonadaceae bacterium]